MGHKFSWPPRNGITLKHASSALVQTDRATCIYILFAYLRQIQPRILCIGRYNVCCASVMLREMWTTRISVAISCNFSLSFSLSLIRWISFLTMGVAIWMIDLGSCEFEDCRIFSYSLSF